MSYMEYHTTERVRVCKLCGDPMAVHTFGIVLRDIHVSPKRVDLHFHEGCFMRALDAARASLPGKVSKR